VSIYAIGDVQGCFTSLQQLLERIKFDPAKDQLWFVGDLVNRGPDSLRVLRFIKGLGTSAVTVLGNHDLHLLAIATDIMSLRPKDTLQDILTAPDREELLHWLRHQPLLYRNKQYVLVHAGLIPQWTVPEALDYSREVEDVLQHDEYKSFLHTLYEKTSFRTQCTEAMHGRDRLTYIANVLTKIRVCSAKGTLELSYKGQPEGAPKGFLPWFKIPNQRNSDSCIIFGHWSALGFQVESQYVGMDSGCVWGGSLSAVRLEDKECFHVPCAESLLNPR